MRWTLPIQSAAQPESYDNLTNTQSQEGEVIEMTISRGDRTRRHGGFGRHDGAVYLAARPTVPGFRC